MAAMRWDTEAQAFTEAETPMKYDPTAGAWTDTTGLAWDPETEAWTEKWSKKKALYIIKDGCFNTSEIGDPFFCNVSSRNMTYSTSNGAMNLVCYSTSAIYFDRMFDISKYSKMCIEVSKIGTTYSECGVSLSIANANNKPSRYYNGVVDNNWTDYLQQMDPQGKVGVTEVDIISSKFSTGKFYISINANAFNQSNPIYLYVKNFWLE